MKRMMQCGIAIMLVIVLLTGCCLSHEWQAATCDAPQTCAKCGQTEGEKLEHTPGAWEVAEEATDQADGIQALKCANCSEILETKPYRLTPERITVLKPNGFVLNKEEYYYHLLRYLPIEYTIDGNILDDGDGKDEIEIDWNEGNQGYQDHITFWVDNLWVLDDLLEIIIMSIDPDVTEKGMGTIMELWDSAKDLGTKGYLVIPLHTGAIFIYNGGNIAGYQVMFCTRQFAGIS